MSCFKRVYIDSILKNGDLIHRMCLLDEQAIRKQSQLIKSQSGQKKCMFLFVTMKVF